MISAKQGFRNDRAQFVEDGKGDLVELCFYGSENSSNAMVITLKQALELFRSLLFIQYVDEDKINLSQCSLERKFKNDPQ
jgi:hypothetical protein